MTDNRRIEELRRRVQSDPASVAFAGLAEEYRKAGRFEESVATCRAGLQRHPVYVSARVTLGRSLLALGRYEEARGELEQVIRVAPENLAAIRALAEIHGRLGDLDPAASNQTPSASARSDVADPPPVVAVKPPQVPTQVLENLESFLASIVRAREALNRGRVSPR